MAAKSTGSLAKWFSQDWRDVKTGEKCGRRKGEKRKYPACRPKAILARMSEAEKRAIRKKKRGRRRVKWKTSPTGRRINRR